MAMVDEQFFIEDTSGLTSVPKVNGLLKTVSQMLLNHYVKMQGGIMSQMLRKSVETRDWLNTVEPRSVRAVMKRVVEEVTAVDRQVGMIKLRLGGNDGIDAKLLKLAKLQSIG